MKQENRRKERKNALLDEAPYLQLVLVENAEQVIRNELVKTADEGADLLLDRIDQSMLSQRVQISQLIVVGDGDLAASGH